MPQRRALPVRPPDYYSGSRWRGTFALDGGGALINQAIHTVDVLVWVLGDAARSRSSRRFTELLAGSRQPRRRIGD